MTLRWSKAKRSKVAHKEVPLIGEPLSKYPGRPA
jgi:hypothetical protein